MANDAVLFAYRLRVLASARDSGSVAAACRVRGIHRSTFYRWKRAVDRFGLEILRPRERRRLQMPNAIPVLVEQRIVAFALGFPGCGPARVASELAPAKHGGFTVSANSVYRVLRRHGLHARALRNALLAGYASPPEPAPSVTCASARSWRTASGTAPHAREKRVEPRPMGDPSDVSRFDFTTSNRDVDPSR